MNPLFNPSHPNFDWLKALEALVADPNAATCEEKNSLNSAASNFPTCACGQLCKALPKRADGSAPEDEILLNLGCVFYGRIGINDWEKALEIFHKIEARTAFLLNQQNQPEQ